MSAKSVAVLVVLLCVGGAVLALVNAGEDEAPRPAAAPAPASPPLELTLKPAHRSGVSGTARLVQGSAGVTVTLRLDERVAGTLPAHIHTGPCSDEPTIRDPRIWVSLTEVIDGRSQSTVTVATLPELQGESASINVHDPGRDLRSLVCGDIPRATSATQEERE
jgi:hypothetical protein